MPSPSATISPQTRQPRQMPSPAKKARRGPSAAAVRSTSAVSRPGVTVSRAAATVKAISDCSSGDIAMLPRSPQNRADSGELHHGGTRMNRLEPGQLWVMRIHATIFALVIALAAIVAETALATRPGLPRGLIAALVLPLIAYVVLVSPGRRYRAWRYAMDADDLRLSRGVWTQVHTLVPLDRVQHIDVSQGPIERGFGVCRLVVHTAGTQYSRVVLPGLSRPNAGLRRDEIRARIGREAE